MGKPAESWANWEGCGHYGNTLWPPDGCGCYVCAGGGGGGGSFADINNYLIL